MDRYEFTHDRSSEDRVSRSLMTQILHLHKKRDSAAWKLGSDLNDLRLGFFKFPFEIRNQIYSEILLPESGIYADGILPLHRYHIYGPDADGTEGTSSADAIAQWNFHHGRSRPRNFLGCTKITLLCHQSYKEATRLLHLQEVRLTISSKQGSALRWPLAFGKPGFFDSARPESERIISPRFCELQVLRLRHIEVDLEFGKADFVGKNDAAQALHHHISELACTLQKSPKLKSLKISLQQYVHTPDDLSCLDSLTVIFGPLIQAGIESQIPLYFVSATENSKYPMRGYAGRLNREVHNRGGQLDRRSFFDPACNTSKAANEALTAKLFAIQYTLTTTSETLEDFELLPECRICLKVFTDPNKLRLHLDQNPTHKQPFRRRTYNTLPPWAKHGGNHKCATCATSFMSKTLLQMHQDQDGHRRRGGLPRFREHTQTGARRGKRMVKMAT